MSHNFPGAYRNANRGAAWGSDLERAHQRGIRPITVVLGQERQHPSERSRMFLLESPEIQRPSIQYIFYIFLKYE